MMPGTVPGFSNTSHQGSSLFSMYSHIPDGNTGGAANGGPSDAHLGSFLCSLSILKEKVNQVQSMVSILIPHENHQVIEPSSSMALASISSLIQEIMVTASSMMFNSQQISLVSSSQAGNNNKRNNNNSNHSNNNDPMVSDRQFSNGDGISQSTHHQGFAGGDSFCNWYTNDSLTANNINKSPNVTRDSHSMKINGTVGRGRKDPVMAPTSSLSPQGFDIVELDAADLLAKYTHYCQVCGKGFKRDANLRMHMRAHGDEYKSTAALSNPLKAEVSEDGLIKVVRKYSCPHEGCRWNKKHAKFQPLKSMICVKNHYKRSHCPKMYVCKRCNRKQFSVLSDLRTHEKHCGDVKWQCSCGTTFSRKDKLMGHVGLFVGHAPMINPVSHNFDNKVNNNHGLQIQFEDR